MAIGGPLAFLAGFLTPSVSLGDVVAATRPRSYARAMPSQTTIAAAQSTGTTLRGGLSGLTGSEADYPEEQAAGDSNIGAPLIALNEGLARRAPMPTSWYVPNLPPELIEGRGTGYVTDAYNKGWVRLLKRGTVWGATTRNTAPNVQPGTLLTPGERTPLPRDMVTAFQDQRRGATRLMDFFGD